MTRVVVEVGQSAWVQEVADDARISIGRALTNTIIIEDTSASREHCAIERDDERRYWLLDLGSRNGTRLNGRFVSRALINPGDRIEIGATSITFTGAGEEGARAAEALEKEARARAEQLRSAEAVDALARDPLTGLASFPAVVLELRRILSAAAPPAGDGAATASELEAPPLVGVVKLDIDYLGLLNDMFGLRAGDDVIAQVARTLVAALAERPEQRAFAGREAGGKFVVLLPGAEAPVAEGVAERVRQRVAAEVLEGSMREARVTLSAGVAVAPGDDRTWDGLLRRAEAALAEAKRHGRDRVARPPQKDGEELSRVAALTDTRGSGLWAASDVWDPQVARGSGSSAEGTGPTSSAAVRAREHAQTQALRLEEPQLAPLILGHAGQSILGLVAQALGSDLELDTLLELTLGIIVDATKARRGFILLREPGGAMRLRMAVDRDVPGLPSRDTALSQGIVGEVLRTRSAVLVGDAQLDDRFKGRQSIVTQGLRSVIAAPILWAKEVVGVIYLDNRSAVDRFAEPERDLLLAFGRLVAGPIRRQALHQAQASELEKARLALARTAELEARRRHRYANIIGESAAIKKLFRFLDRLSESHHPVLIHGESGTGKELVASAIHYNGPRKTGPFIAENVAAVSETLLEAELFGHVRGAFTGADQDRVGLFEAADGGTLFLDEIGEMSERMQAKLLRVLQEGELRPVGGRDVKKVDVRLICATNKNLLQMSREGTFREDLYYRIAVMTVELPPLRERREDVPLLLDHFLRQIAQQERRPAPEVSREALQLLVHHDWPGNVRELENTTKALFTLAGERILPAHLPPKLLGGAAPDRAQSAIRRVAVTDGADAMMLMVERGRPLEEIVSMFEREAIVRVLAAAGGNRSETARRLGLSRPGLLKKMKRYGVS
ncbi:MAG: sigma 54-interacting transcriptional regulator [Planctomycetes bacterium]|nr:sigma 54-interacting transcriptional regulator [Planctomycetota bacterium]